jgi:hypothetical protein
MVSKPEVAVRKGSAYLVRGGLKNRPGTLLLYSDRLVHVASKLAMAGGGFGMLGVLVTRGIANARADAQAAKGGKSVLVLPLNSISSVEVEKRKAKRKSGKLVVHTTNGENYRFTASSVDEWSAALTETIRSQGRTTEPNGTGFRVI